jgi:signal transduction histidine kinase
VDAHGGHVRADNNADGGATFQFTLPAERVAS